MIHHCWRHGCDKTPVPVETFSIGYSADVLPYATLFENYYMYMYVHQVVAVVFIAERL